MAIDRMCVVWSPIISPVVSYILLDHNHAGPLQERADPDLELSIGFLAVVSVDLDLGFVPCSAPLSQA